MARGNNTFIKSHQPSSIIISSSAGHSAGHVTRANRTHVVPNQSSNEAASRHIYFFQAEMMNTTAYAQITEHSDIFLVRQVNLAIT
ncbi:MAG: hypothetical protein BWX80_04136 [Candidatus Hydrogenedentes bacterium ADurb.Bin101]|nr:MAG: hypothetical protein BWX80_04136 [Candidatus Hydrogenedentes bacterium ADurb.Bin101]